MQANEFGEQSVRMNQSMKSVSDSSQQMLSEVVSEVSQSHWDLWGSRIKDVSNEEIKEEMKEEDDEPWQLIH